MSRSAFSHQFKKSLNDTPVAFLPKVRLSRSAGQLRTTQKSVDEVGAATGFSQPKPLLTVVLHAIRRCARRIPPEVPV